MFKVKHFGIQLYIWYESTVWKERTFLLRTRYGNVIFVRLLESSLYNDDSSNLTKMQIQVCTNLGPRWLSKLTLPQQAIQFSLLGERYRLTCDFIHFFYE